MTYEPTFHLKLTCPYCGKSKTWNKVSFNEPTSGLTFCEEEDNGCGERYAYSFTRPQYVVATTYGLTPTPSK